MFLLYSVKIVSFFFSVMVFSSVSYNIYVCLSWDYIFIYWLFTFCGPLTGKVKPRRRKTFWLKKKIGIFLLKTFFFSVSGLAQELASLVKFQQADAKNLLFHLISPIAVQGSAGYGWNVIRLWRHRAGYRDEVMNVRS